MYTWMRSADRSCHFNEMRTVHENGATHLWLDDKHLELIRLTLRALKANIRLQQSLQRRKRNPPGDEE